MLTDYVNMEKMKNAIVKMQGIMRVVQKFADARTVRYTF